ncbi:hypothetical protein [Sphingomonas japonica]|uniref:Uncharacterized protein n=1 Tax=Sphingomonas japonica TaxID=511662 RepID=A0ABX0U0J9_9SPHN|nr:hypothetical protein [Sphingomonas japonica]NIJ24095.1 hypothetical protein [Sphingomonas japonica]
MEMKQERTLREHVAYLAIDWNEREGQHFAGADAAEFGAMVTTAHVIHDEARIALQRWIDAARRAGMSWAEIGGLIGISKQAAQQRFGGKTDGPAAEGELIEIGGMTAFNEESELARAGRDGLELAGVGFLRLWLSRSDRRWEYRRVTALSPVAALRQVSGPGWQHAASWFPFHYLKREIPDA